MSKLKYALFTGCTARQSTPEQMMSTMAIAEKMNIELEILEEATCCGASHLQDYDEFLSLVLNARNICYAESRGMTMVTICNTCQLNTMLTKRRLDNLKKMVVKPLAEFNIAPFYGCHNIRPSETHEDSNGHENAYAPRSLDDLILACGGHNVDYDEKNKCCGFHAELQAPHTAATLTGNALMGAMDNNADWMVTPCPLCHLKLDTQYEHASKAVGRDVKLPVLHMQQMIGLAFGISGKELGLQHHVSEVNFA